MGEASRDAGAVRQGLNLRQANMGRSDSSEGGYATAMKIVADLTFNLPLIDTMPAQCRFQIEEPGTILNRNGNINPINRSDKFSACLVIFARIRRPHHTPHNRPFVGGMRQRRKKSFGPS
jgi:hypothetical protein